MTKKIKEAVRRIEALFPTMCEGTMSVEYATFLSDLRTVLNSFQKKRRKHV